MEGCPLSDSELMERARRGDVAAYEELVRRYEEVAFRTAFLVCGDADEARDAAQEGFVRAWRALPRFRAGSEPARGCCGSWPMRLATAAVAHRGRPPGPPPGGGPLSGGAAPSPEGSVLPPSDAGAAGRHRAGRDDRLIIGLRWFVDLDEAAMAAALGSHAGR